MPKFLDAPSWYDSDGTLRTIQDTISVKVGGSTSSIVLPTLSNISTSYDAYFVPGTSGQFAGGVYWFSSNGPQISGQGTSGQVLTSNGNAAPSWENRTLSVIKIIGYQGPMNKFAGTFVLPGKYDIGYSFTGSDLYTTLNDLLGNGTDDEDNNSYFPASGFVWWGSSTSGWNMIGLGAYPGTSSSYRYIQFFYIRYGTDYNMSIPVIDNRGVNYSSIESAVVVSNIP